MEWDLIEDGCLGNYRETFLCRILLTGSFT